MPTLFSSIGCIPRTLTLKKIGANSKEMALPFLYKTIFINNKRKEDPARG